MKPSVLFLSILVLSLLSVVLVGCGSDDSTSPDPVPDPTLVTEGVIGSGGGDLQTDEVVLTIPAGALTEDTELKIFDESDTAPFGQEGLPVYAIEGLPEDLGMPVGLRFQHGVTEKAGVSLFLGELRDARSVGRELFWELAASRDSSGWCLTQLARGPIDFGDKADAKMRAAIAEGLVSTTPSAHFQVHYLESNFDATRAAWSQNMLEEAYDHLYDLGFHFGEQDTIWPVSAYMVAPESSIAAFVCGPHGKGHFRIPPHNAEQSNLIKSIYMHETFHLAQMWYDTRPSEEWIRLNNERTWFDEATASWSELHFYPGYFWPVSMDTENYAAPLAGVAGHPTLSAVQYGYGMASFIKAMVTEQGVSAVNDIFVEFVLHNQDSVEALQVVLDPPLADWCLSFQQSLVGNEIYDLEALGFDPLGGFFHMNLMPRDVGDLYDFDLRVRDYGSDGEVIELAHAGGEDEADALRIRVTGDVVLSAFRTNSIDPPSLITFGVDSLTIGGLSTIHNAGEYILVLATKDWADDPGWGGHLDVDVEVEMLPTGSLDSFIRGGINAVTQITWAGGGEESMGLVLEPYTTTDGQWTGNEFMLEWDTIAGQVTDTGFITFTIDPQSLDITSFESQYLYYQSDVDVERYYEISGGALPLLSNEDGVVTWRVEGAATCNTLTSRYQREVREGEITEESIGFSCLDSGIWMSYMEIHLWDPDQ